MLERPTPKPGPWRLPERDRERLDSETMKEEQPHHREIDTEVVREWMDKANNFSARMNLGLSSISSVPVTGNSW
jgi:hypothetical protein